MVESRWTRLFDNFEHGAQKYDSLLWSFDVVAWIALVFGMRMSPLSSNDVDTFEYCFLHVGLMLPFSQACAKLFQLVYSRPKMEMQVTQKPSKFRIGT